MDVSQQTVPFVGVLFGFTQEISSDEEAFNHFLTSNDIRYVLFIVLIQDFQMF